MSGPKPRRWPLCANDPRTLITRAPASQRATTPASARVVSTDCTKGCPSGATAPGIVPPSRVSAITPPVTKMAVPVPVS